MSKNSKKANNTLETWGNESTMNLNAIIYQNILSSPYFRSLFTKKTFHEIVDEIYNEVFVLCPFVKGSQPSTAYCCLFKLWTLRLTVKQIENLVDHGDSPYIRAVGFLYLRYVCAPANLWDWFQYYLEDDEEITISSGPNPTKVTIGKFVRMLITEPKFQSTMLPRIPVPIARDLEKKLQEYDREHKKQSSGRSHYNDEDYSRERDRSRDRSRRSSRSRSVDRRRDRRDDYERRSDRYESRSRDNRDTRDEFDDYERRRSRRDRSRSKDRYRRDSISPDYRRRDRRSRSRESSRRDYR